MDPQFDLVRLRAVCEVEVAFEALHKVAAATLAEVEALQEAREDDEEDVGTELLADATPRTCRIEDRRYSYKVGF